MKGLKISYKIHQFSRKSDKYGGSYKYFSERARKKREKREKKREKREKKREKREKGEISEKIIIFLFLSETSKKVIVTPK